jgi:hypothetical protein
MRARLLCTAIALAALTPQPARAQPCSTQICARPSHYLSAANTNATLVLGRPTALYTLTAINTTATIYYLKLYDKATAPTCGTDTPVATYPLLAEPAAGTGVALVIARATGAGFNLGLGFCLVGGIADNDTSNAATGVAINLEYRQ